VVTIHDLAWKYFPESFTPFMRNFLEWSTGFAVKRASGIIAVSQSTGNDLVKFYGVDPNKIFVVHHGYEPAYQPISLSADQLLPKNYVLFLATLQPRKNLEGLIDAFRILKTQNPDLPHKLVIAGKPGWKFEPILEKIKQNKDIAVYLNHVSDQDRFALLKRADLLVLPSFYEGFGMQILESFDAGVPVATSNISSMPEVAGEAAVYFDPKNISDIAKAIKMVLTDKSLADGLRAKGKERLKNFSWEKCACETLKELTKFKELT
jgi:glycosyltransferase involved in cell wall biosynthesis